MIWVETLILLIRYFRACNTISVKKDTMLRLLVRPGPFFGRLGAHQEPACRNDPEVVHDSGLGALATTMPSKFKEILSLIQPFEVLTVLPVLSSLL
jgi:hypothetical protein